MKIFITTLLFITSLLGARIDEFAKEVGYLRDYNSALKIAKKENKMIMLVVVADYCPWCKKFERKTLQSLSISTKIKKDFIPAIVDKYREKEHYPKKYNSSAIPGVFFIDPNTENSIYKSISYVNKKDFSLSIDEALNSYKEVSK
ncbi:thioredoxin family protein [Candidatus Sulfurimonas marisnigri]|uniref:Thioredoxin family protein n=1 Tax=Candidatus Sulfurimonas marisnigri TaxID=2740405 RepID=A0A7S7RQK5_9BACT|nr:thioredoxin family protein [Candidatus Sulfurimonas marisnigri]QOY55527.1 thioredoxin family protein [Candidatus Sulfurimonas marisnigri]